MRDALRDQLPVVGVEGRLPDAGGQLRERKAADDEFSIANRELGHRCMGRERGCWHGMSLERRKH